METTKQPISKNDWQSQLLREIAENEDSKAGLFDLLYLIWDFRDREDPTEFIAHIFSFWAMNSKSDLSKERHRIVNLVDLLAFIQKLKSGFEFFDNNAEYTIKHSNRGIREVNRE